MALSGNKGEWSEVYVLLKLLSDQKLQLGNEKLEKIKGAVYKIISILRHDDNKNIVYDIDSNINIKVNGKSIGSFTIGEFSKWANYLFDSLKKHGKGSYSDKQLEEYLKKIACNHLKAKSTDKRDITLVIYDEKTRLTPAMGFSIKSQLGSPSTLVNASARTNATFEIVGEDLTKNEIDDINDIKHYEEKFEILTKKGCHLRFLRIDDRTFENNLIMVDTLFPKMIGEILLLHYSGKARKLSDIANALEKSNPLGYDLLSGHKFYHHKIKSFLSDYALGMLASKVWNGVYDANGGYIIVKSNGDLICYHFYYKNLFEEYLINNTKTETGDLGRIARKTGNYTGLIFKEAGKIYFRLNLQIRFMV